ncbi:MAG: exodeoxyribonuclease V subunit alpha [Rubrivivax sp.]|jgi:exodeoxyribonuclease V alpha subunit
MSTTRRPRSTAPGQAGLFDDPATDATSEAQPAQPFQASPSAAQLPGSRTVVAPASLPAPSPMPSLQPLPPGAPPAWALAEGLAQQLRAWGARLGAPAQAVALAARAARAVSLAHSEGHVALALTALLSDPAATAALQPLDTTSADGPPDFQPWADDDSTAHDDTDLSAFFDPVHGFHNAQAADPDPAPSNPDALARLRHTLLASGLVGTPQAPGALPLVLDDGNRLYLHRLFALERQLAQRLHAAASAPPQALDAEALARLAELFAGNRAALGEHTVDWQRAAVALALRQRLAVVSGGPGTGKTTAVVNLLVCLLAAQPQARILLAAPTGKAAARLTEALRERSSALPAAWAHLAQALPTEAFTVHRLLGVLPGGGGVGGFRHHAHHPLALDVLVVDEASMLDLALATRLLDAVPPHARVVLLGDKDQLAAVESGAVFAELSGTPHFSAATAQALAQACGVDAHTWAQATAADTRDTATPPAALVDSVVWFRQNYRFGLQSGIGRLATQVREGLADAALATLAAAQAASHRPMTLAAVEAASYLPTTSAAGQAVSPAEPAPAADHGLAWLPDGTGPQALAAAQAGYAPLLQAVQALPPGALAEDALVEAAQALHQTFANFRVLCALREGPAGVHALNQALARPLRQASGAAPHATWYSGRAVMVTRNDYTLRLFNGDIGIALPSQQADGGTAWVAAFPLPDRSFRLVPVARLPAHQDALAMTVHKAQGSEFAHVLLLLPAQRSPVLTRELLYTALTRGKRRATLAGPAAVLRRAILNPTQRLSGLQARLQEVALPAADLASPTERP